MTSVAPFSASESMDAGEKQPPMIKPMPVTKPQKEASDCIFLPPTMTETEKMK